MSTMTTLDPQKLVGYEVPNAMGNKMGSVERVWLADGTNDPEFIGVKTGWLRGKNHVMPIIDARIDRSTRTIHVAYDTDLIKRAPTYAGDGTLSQADKEKVYRHYGVDRSSAARSGVNGDAGKTTGPLRR